jgi:hypothetical protein
MTLYTAILVEPAQSLATNFCLANLHNCLGPDWGILFYHGPGLADWAAAQIPPEAAERISLHELPDAPLAEFLVSREFLQKIPTEVYLQMRTDSMIFPENAHKLAKFLEYDYVGAPWPWDHLHVGNGHLSLRRKSVLMRILDTLGPNTSQYEDLYVSHGCTKICAKVPSREVAREFSVSQLFHEAPFGFHRPWDHLPTRFDELCEFCPGLKTLRDLNSGLSGIGH